MTPAALEAIRERRQKKYFGVHFEAEMDDVSALLSHIDALREALEMLATHACNEAATDEDAERVFSKVYAVLGTRRALGDQP
jgi:hypothetical protein